MIKLLQISLLTFLLASCAHHPAPLHSWNGITMGTFYTITLNAPTLNKNELNTLQQQTGQVLSELNGCLSVFNPESEISAVNQAPPLIPIPLSEPLYKLIDKSLALCKTTDGYFDPTVEPLIKLWGFSNEDRPTPPSLAEIMLAKQISGYEAISLVNGALIKAEPRSLNFGAIAKGYAVDQLRALYQEQQLSDFIINIGGELFVSGQAPDKNPWNIGIETPHPDELETHVMLKFIIDQRGVATSGNYQQYKTMESGERYSHIIDPRTGRPTQHQLASVTVIAPTCLAADALATAVYVMGPERGMKFIEKQDNTEACFIVRKGNNRFQTELSTGFPRIDAL